MSRKPENATAGEVTAAESRVRVLAVKAAVSLETGEAGIQKIIEGFPYFDIFVEVPVVGHRSI